MTQIILTDGKVLFRDNKPASSVECCRGCCCKDGKLDRSYKFQNTCESAGGVWGPCPGASICECTCVPVVFVNGVEVAPGDPGFGDQYTAVGTEDVDDTIIGSASQWRFSAITYSGCLPNVFPPTILTTVVIRVELWYRPGPGSAFQNATVDQGSLGFNAYIFEFLSSEQACFDDEPNSWPCAKSQPTFYGGPADANTAGVQQYFGFFGIGFTDAQLDEYEGLVGPYLAQPVVSLDCVFDPACE